MDEEQRVEGIILKVFPYGDFDRIFTLFTADRGLQKLLFKGRLRKDRTAAVTPLVKIDALYLNSRSDLYRCAELKVTETYPHLRQDWECLQAGCAMASALLKLQFLAKPAPALFALFEFYLEKLATNPANLRSSFYMKALLHEGLIHCTDRCAACSAPIEEAFLADGEPYCKSHAPGYALPIEKGQWPLLLQLALCRSLQELTILPLTSATANKAEEIFNYCIN